MNELLAPTVATQRLELTGEPRLAGLRRCFAATNLVRLARNAAFGGSKLNKRFSGCDQALLEQVVVLVLQVLAGLLCVVPGAVAKELTLGLLEGHEQLADFLSGRRRGRLSECSAGDQEQECEECDLHAIEALTPELSRTAARHGGMVHVTI